MCWHGGSFPSLPCLSLHPLYSSLSPQWLQPFVCDSLFQISSRNAHPCFSFFFCSKPCCLRGLHLPLPLTGILSLFWQSVLSLLSLLCRTPDLSVCLCLVVLFRFVFCFSFHPRGVATPGPCTASSPGLKQPQTGPGEQCPPGSSQCAPWNWVSSFCVSGIYQFRVLESSKSGTPVGRIKATDRDTGKNAEMYFTIVSGDGMDMFDISTDKETQEGVITVSKVSSRRVTQCSYSTSHIYTPKKVVQRVGSALHFQSGSTSVVKPDAPCKWIC